MILKTGGRRNRGSSTVRTIRDERAAEPSTSELPQTLKPTTALNALVSLLEIPLFPTKRVPAKRQGLAAANLSYSVVALYVGDL